MSPIFDTLRESDHPDKLDRIPAQAVLQRIIDLRLLDRTAGQGRGGVSCYLAMQNGELNTDGLLKLILGRGEVTPSMTTTVTSPLMLLTFHRHPIIRTCHPITVTLSVVHLNPITISRYALQASLQPFRPRNMQSEPR